MPDPIPPYVGLGALYRAIENYLRNANVGKVPTFEEQYARRLLASGRFSGGRCEQCGLSELHAHGTVE